MELNRYAAPSAEWVSAIEADLLADSFSNGEPIEGPLGAWEDWYYDM